MVHESATRNRQGESGSGGAPSITLCVQFSPQRGARTIPILDDVGTRDAGAAGMAVIHA